MRAIKQKGTTLIILLLLLIPTAYIVQQLITIYDRPYHTETAILYDMSDSLVCEGFLSFDQTAVSGEGMLGYLVNNGERVAESASVAEIYTDESQARARQSLRRLEQQQQLLETSENTVGIDIDVLLNQRQNALYNLLDQMDVQAYQDTATQANHYLLAVNRLQITTGVIRDFSEAKQLLEEEKTLLLSQLGQPEAVLAPQGGYFVSAASGQWLNLPRQELDEMSAASLQQTILSGEGVSGLSGAGKIVHSYKWYFYTTCTAEDSKKFEGMNKINISFPSKAEKTLPAKVESLTPDLDSGLVKVVLSCEYVGADVLSLVQATAKLDFVSYEGVRINAKALHLLDGEKGVYVKYGNISRFRKITILYQNDDYILVPLGGKVNSDNEIRLFDEIIVEGADLQDGKLL